jgi:hypothetical protein
MQQQHAIEFFFIEEATSLWGFHWLIEWSTSSFYIKCLHPGLQSAKVSLHGPDPKHPGKQHLRFDLDKRDLVDRATRAGGRWSSGSDPLPYYFTGRQVNDHAAHIVRFSAGWDTFIRGAPGPGNSREWLFRLAWQLRIWNDLPTCIATAIEDTTSPVQDVSTRLTDRTRDFLYRARDLGSASASVTADELFELITAVSWAIDRFGDDPKRARHRVGLATAGVFKTG